MRLQADIEKLKAGAFEFLSWWKEELTACIPAELRQRLEHRARRVTIRPARDHVELDIVMGAEGRTLREAVPLAGLDDAGWNDLEALLEDSVSRIRLSGRDIFVTSVSLPVAAARNLRQAIELQLPLISPLLPSAICWGYRISDRTADRMKVTVALARKADLDRIADLFDTRGLVPPPVEALTPEGVVRLRPGRARHWSQERRQSRVALLVGCLLLASIPVTIWAGSAVALWAGGQSLEAVRAQAAPISAAARRAELADARRRALAPLARQAAFAPVLDDLAMALPETAYLDSVRFGGPEDISFVLAGQVDGKSADAVQEGSKLLMIEGDGTAAEEGVPQELRARLR